MRESHTENASVPSELLQQAAQWRLVGLLFEPPCDDWREQLKSLTLEVCDDHLAAIARQAQVESDEGAYHSTFGPGGPASAREVSYHRSLTPGGLLAELKGWYDAFGYTPICPEAPDHVAVEAGFVAYLYFKQAYAVANGQYEQAQAVANAVTRFQTEHLAVSAAPLAQALHESGIRYAAAAAAALQARVGPPLTDGRDIESRDDDDRNIEHASQAVM